MSQTVCPACKGTGYEGKSNEGNGYDFSSDPLNAGGFGPNDATIPNRGDGPTRTGLGRTPCKMCEGKGYVKKGCNLSKNRPQKGLIASAVEQSPMR
jgi:hypothetical protein